MGWLKNNLLVLFQICLLINTRILTTKVTLTVEKDVIERAEAYAKDSGRSLSELSEQYLDTLTQENRTQSISLMLKN